LSKQISAEIGEDSLYQTVFDAFVFSLSHFDLTKYKSDYNIFIEKLVDIIDYLNKNNTNNNADIINFISELEYLLDTFHNSYESFIAASNTIDSILEIDFPNFVTKIENFKGITNA
jgi:hypothetical protein